MCIMIDPLPYMCQPFSPSIFARGGGGQGPLGHPGSAPAIERGEREREREDAENNNRKFVA